MADSLFDILSKRDFDEPEEVSQIKRYIKKQFSEHVEVVVREREILICASSAAFVGTLRFHIPQLQKAANTKKRIVLRIR